jgi:hypothetical protein
VLVSTSLNLVATILMEEAYVIIYVSDASSGMSFEKF